MRYLILSHDGVIEFTGKEAESFLQGRVTCDVRTLQQSSSIIGALCNTKGRVMATFRLWRWHDRFLMQLPRELIENTAQLLAKYAQFSAVEIHDASENWHCIGYWGEKNSFTDCLTIAVDEKSHRNLILASPEIPSPLLETLTKLGTTVPEYEWRLADIRQGIAVIEPDTVGMFTPHDINYPAIGGVSFNKGCYTGQEIITRMEFRGKLKQHLYYISLISKELLKPGAIITLSNTANMIIMNAVKTDNNIYEALVVAQDQVIADYKNQGLFTLCSNQI